MEAKWLDAPNKRARRPNKPAASPHRSLPKNSEAIRSPVPACSLPAPSHPFRIKMSSIGLRLASAASSSRATRLAPTRLSQTCKAWSTSARKIHTRKPLPYNIEDGMGEFLTPQGLKMVAVDYQQGLLDRLNEQVEGALARSSPLAPV